MSQPKPSSSSLPAKEAGLFKQVAKFYETKQYKKGLKAAETILKKFPEHGETLAMKALTLRFLPNYKKEEVYELIRRGLKNDLKSHICWHVYGLLYRQDKEYKEAIKCFLNALRIDKENFQIQRDVAVLQIQVRDLAGFQDSRQTLLAQKPSNRANWVSYAVAHHMNKNFELAVQILDAYEQTLEGDASNAAVSSAIASNANASANDAYERSELILYTAQILTEGGLYSDAISRLEKKDSLIKDRLLLRDLLAFLHLKLAAQDEEQVQQLDSAAAHRAQAEKLYRELLATNPNNYRFHEGLQAALRLRADPPSPIQDGVRGKTWAGAAALTSGSGSGSGSSTSGPDAKRRALSAQLQWASALTSAQREELRVLYLDLQNQFPKSNACKRIPLDFLVGDAFAAEADAFMRPFLLRGVPSLFAELRPLYADAAKAKTLESLSLSYLRDVLSGGGLPAPLTHPGAVEASAAADSNSNSNNSNANSYSPQTEVWIRYYLTLQYDFLGRHSLAMQHLDASLAHTPTLIELHTARGSALKHAGDLEAAAQSVEMARRMDLQDRFLNTIAVRALARAGHIEAADKTAALFLREATVHPASALADMQHAPFEISTGRAYFNQGKYGMALKRFRSVIQHFDDFVDDQFDFHSYCMRKAGLRSYVAMLRFCDKVHGHPAYGKAAWGAIQCYLRLHDCPPKKARTAEEEAAVQATMTPDELKEYKKKKKKEEKEKKEKEEKEKKEKEERERREKEQEKEKKKKGSSSANNAANKAAAANSDPDPLGEALAATETPLGEAKKLVDILKLHAAERLQTQLAAFEIALRRGKLLQTVSAARRAVEIAGVDHPEAHLCVIRAAMFYLLMDQQQQQQQNKNKEEEVEKGEVAVNPTVKALASDALVQLLRCSSSNGDVVSGGVGVVGEEVKGEEKEEEEEGKEDGKNSSKPGTQSGKATGGIPDAAAAPLCLDDVRQYQATWMNKYALVADKAEDNKEEEQGGEKSKVSSSSSSSSPSPSLSNKGSLAHRIAAARAMVVVNSKDNRNEALALIFSSPLTSHDASHAQCVEVHRLFTESPAAKVSAVDAAGLEALVDKESAERWAINCAEAFPYSAFFGGEHRVTLEDPFEFENLTTAFGKLSFL